MCIAIPLEECSFLLHSLHRQCLPARALLCSSRDVLRSTLEAQVAQCKLLAFLVEDQGRLITEDAVAVEAEYDLLLLFASRRRTLIELQTC